MTARRRRVDPELSRKRAEAGRRGAAARWGTAMASVATTSTNEGAAPMANQPRDWVRVAALSSSRRAVVDIYDEIGYFGTSAEAFIGQLRDLDVDELEVHINSPGGAVFEGIAIYNALLDHDAHVEVHVDGIAASAASFIAQAGDVVIMNRSSEMMIHDPMGLTVGNAADHREMADRLDRFAQDLASIYAARAGGGTARWRAAMEAETWYSAEEAVEAGLADSVKRTSRRRGMDDAEDRWDLSIFNHQGRAQAPAPDIRPAARTAPTSGDVIPERDPGTDLGMAEDDAPPADASAHAGVAGDDSTQTDDLELTDDQLASAADSLAAVFEDQLTYDPDDIAALITNAFANRPAPTPTDRPDPVPPDHVSVADFATALQEALTR
jgi:ATP-dependent Clp endopeptidase proteolytic subunit ClpP